MHILHIKKTINEHPLRNLQAYNFPKKKPIHETFHTESVKI